jgi:hypothetical protein
MRPRHDRAPVWLGPALATLGIVGILLAGVIYPVVDPRDLKMSCYWAMRGAIALHALLAACGLAAMLASSRDGARTAALLAGACSVMLLVTLHGLIPVMPAHVHYRTPHDLLAAMALGTAAAGWWAARPETRLDEALDALAAAPGEPGP